MIHVEPLVYNAFQVNTFLISTSSGDCLVIDPSFYTPEEQAAFESHLAAKNLKVVGQLNTHCHVDHMLGVQHCKDQFSVPFRAHEAESPLVANVPLMGDMYGLSVEPFSGIDKPIEDLEQIQIGEYTLQSILVPGHSPGSLSYYSKEGGFVITGDALFQGSIGRTDLPGGDYDTLINSITTRLLSLPPETVVYPGHGPSSTIGEEIAHNPFLNMNQ